MTRTSSKLLKEILNKIRNIKNKDARIAGMAEAGLVLVLTGLSTFRKLVFEAQKLLIGSRKSGSSSMQKIGEHSHGLASVIRALFAIDETSAATELIAKAPLDWISCADLYESIFRYIYINGNRMLLVKEKKMRKRLLDQWIRATKKIESKDMQFDFLGDIADAMVESGFVSRALTILESVKDPKERDFNLRFLCPDLVHSGKARKAIALTEKIRCSREKSSTLCEIAYDLADLGKPDYALRLAKTIKDRNYRSWIEEAACAAFVRTGKIRRAYDMASKIRDPYAQASAYERIARVLQYMHNEIYRDDSSSKEAEAALGTSLEIAKKIESKPDRSRMLGIIGELQALMGIRGYRETIEKALSLAKYDKWLDSFLSSRLVKNLCRSGLLRRASEVISGFKDKTHQEFMYWEMVSCLVELRNIGEAIKISKRIEETDLRFDAITNILHAIADTKDNRFQVLWKQALRVNARTDEIQEQVDGLVELVIIIAFAETGKKITLIAY